MEVENWSFILFFAEPLTRCVGCSGQGKASMLEPGGWAAPGLSIGNPSSRVSTWRLGTWRCFLTPRSGSLLNFNYLGSSLCWRIWLNWGVGKGSSVTEFSNTSGCRMNGAECTLHELLAAWYGHFCAMGKPGSLGWERSCSSYVWHMSNL